MTVRHRHGDIVAVVEIVSPGNKSSRADFDAFRKMSVELIQQGVHLLVVDLFPPTPRDPAGVHRAIWDEFGGEEEPLNSETPLTLASYDSASRVAYVDNIAVGGVLPEMPLFLKPEIYVPIPLESTYLEAWATFPNALKELLE